jgi:hypothetical protein
VSLKAEEAERAEAERIAEEAHRAYAKDGYSAFRGRF